MSTGSTTDRVRTFSADVTASQTARDGFEAFRREREEQTGEAWPLAGLDLAGSTDFRIKVRSVTAHDVVVSDVYSQSYVGRTTADREADAPVLLHVMQRGSWHFARLDGRDQAVTVPAGSFIARHDGPPSLFDVSPAARVTVLILPARIVAPLLGGRSVVGSARSAEARLLMAHVNLLSELACDLTPAGLLAARDALLELVRGALRREFDDAEPRLALALARAAMELADSRLAAPELSPASLARSLNVSVRTLQRAFTAAGEPATAYIRRRRLEQARLELASHRRPSISEVAARWQFADSSHFTRAFKDRYALTPAEYARANEPDRDSRSKNARP
jgi:AraC-like DNA-binding protein